jgi:TMEM175 potassium channel family protein
MTTSRLEAFSDGVVAILITIMVLELRPPHEATFQSLKPLIPVLFSYLLSFIFLGIYWSNHHHLFHAAQQVNGRVLWANLHLLFWLSLIPFVTAWMGENHFGSAPVALYGIILLLAAIAYTILVQSLLSLHGPDSLLATALGSDFKGKISIVLDLIAIPLAFLKPWVAFAIYVLVAVMWLVPDSRIERKMATNSTP